MAAAWTGRHGTVGSPSNVACMHVAPVVVIDHAAGPDAWIDRLGLVASAVDDHPDLPITLRVPGAAVELVARTRPELWGRLRSAYICWLAGGWSDPLLVHLPPDARRAQLARERATMESAGVVPAGLWTGEGWEPALISLAVEAGLGLVVFDHVLVGGAVDRPGAVDRAGETVLAVPVSSRVDEWGADDLAAVRVEPDDLAAFAQEHRGRLTTPDWYLSDHLPGPRLAPTVTVPGRPSDAEPFYRKLLLVTRQRPEKGTGTDRLLTLQSREYTLGTAVDIDGHRRLLETRRDLERAVRRGDSWVAVSEVDWDADGCDEVQIETWYTSLILDPAAGTLDVWEDKATSWPITAVTPSLAGVLMRTMDGEGGEPPVRPMHLDRRTAGRSEAKITLVDDEGGKARIHLNEEHLTLELHVAGGDPVRVGPEVPLLMDAGSTRIRVDGGPWVGTDEPLALMGHRFRLACEDRTMLISAARPTEMYVRPLEGTGLVAWPHWPTTGNARYDVRFSPS